MVLKLSSKEQSDAHEKGSPSNSEGNSEKENAKEIKQDKSLWKEKRESLLQCEHRRHAQQITHINTEVTDTSSGNASASQSRSRGPITRNSPVRLATHMKMRGPFTASESMNALLSQPPGMNKKSNRESRRGSDPGSRAQCRSLAEKEDIASPRECYESTGEKTVDTKERVRGQTGVGFDETELEMHAKKDSRMAGRIMEGPGAGRDRNRVGGIDELLLSTCHCTEKCNCLVKFIHSIYAYLC